MARSLLLLLLVSSSSRTLGDRSETEESRTGAYPMMQKYMELLHDHVGRFKTELSKLDAMGTAAEHESKKFGDHVDYMNHGLENFRSQVRTFRQVVAKTAREQLEQTKTVLKNGQWKGAIAAGQSGGQVGVFNAGSSSGSSSLIQAHAHGSPGDSATPPSTESKAAKLAAEELNPLTKGQEHEDDAAAERRGEINAAIKILQSAVGHESSSTHHHHKKAKLQSKAGEPSSTPVDKEHGPTHSDSSDSAPQAQKVHSSGALSKQSNGTAPTEKDQSVSDGTATTEKEKSAAPSTPEVAPSTPDLKSVAGDHEGAMEVEH